MTDDKTTVIDETCELCDDLGPPSEAVRQGVLRCPECGREPRPVPPRCDKCNRILVCADEDLLIDEIARRYVLTSEVAAEIVSDILNWAADVCDDEAEKMSAESGAKKQ